MKYNNDIHKRRSIRLKNYDYSQPGAYFITICTQNRLCLFGDMVDEEMVLNGAGELIKYTWFDLHKHNSDVMLDAFAIMPDHIHGVIIINDLVVGAGSEPAHTELPLPNLLLRINDMNCPKSSVNSKHFPQNVSMHRLAHPVFPSGSAIIMTTSFVMKTI